MVTLIFELTAKESEALNAELKKYGGNLMPIDINVYVTTTSYQNPNERRRYQCVVPDDTLLLIPHWECKLVK